MTDSQSKLVCPIMRAQALRNGNFQKMTGNGAIFCSLPKIWELLPNVRICHNGNKCLIGSCPSVQASFATISIYGRNPHGGFEARFSSDQFMSEFNAVS